MAIMVALDFPLQDGKQAEFLELLGGALPDTRAFEGCLRLRTHNQNRTVAARAIADMKTFGHLS